MGTINYIFRNVIAALALTCVITPSFGGEYFVVPNTGGSNGDGSSGQPWQGFDNIAWDSVTVGSTINVLGSHRGTLVINQSDITVNLDHPAAPGEILGTKYLSGDDSGWHRKGSRYSISHPFIMPSTNKRNFPAVLLRNGEIILKDKDGYLAANEWTWSNGTLTLGFDPAGSIIEVGNWDYGITFPIAGGNFGDVTVNGGRFIAQNEWAFAPNDNATNVFDDIVISNAFVFGSEEQGIHIYNNTQVATITIKNCIFQEIGGEGIYLKNTVAMGGMISIKDNQFGSTTLKNFGWSGDNSDFAGDAIDVGLADGNNLFPVEIIGNTINNVRGSGIISRSGDTLIEGNTVRQAQLVGASDQKAAIVLDPQYPASVLVKNNYLSNTEGSTLIIRGNTSADSPITIESNYIANSTNSGTKVISLPTANNTNITIHKNQLIGGEVGFFMYGENPYNININNNSFYNNDTQVELNKYNYQLSGMTFKGNVFYLPPGGGSVFKTISKIYSAEVLNNSQELNAEANTDINIY